MGHTKQHVQTLNMIKRDQYIHVFIIYLKKYMTDPVEKDRYVEDVCQNSIGEAVLTNFHMFFGPQDTILLNIFNYLAQHKLKGFISFKLSL